MTAAERLQAYRDALAVAERNYELADMIDSTARRDREQAALMPRIKALHERIKEWEWVIENTDDDLFAPVKGTTNVMRSQDQDLP